MRRSAECILFLLLSLRAHSQEYADDVHKSKRHPWWVLYLSGGVHPPDVTIGQGRMGWGSGQTFLFSINSKIPSNKAPFWLGVDFNQHYFGTVTIAPYRVHYENWQMTVVSRFTNTSQTAIKPFIDFQLGGRYLVALTTYDRNYSGIVLLRSEDIVAAVLNLPANSSDEYRIEKEYGKLMWVGGFSPGILIPWNKKNFGGITLRASVLFGSPTRFADSHQIRTVNDVYDYPLKNGSRFYYTFQLGITL